MVIEMRYLKEKTVYTYEVNKSIFIAILYPLNKIDDLKTSLEQARTEYPKATHYCSASLYGDNQEQQTADDDGEPHRTAGIPILEVLKHHDVTHILCVVIRYFGGIKLGAGGLVRAYTKACADCMKQATFYQKLYVDTYEITFGYQDIDTIDRFLKEKATIIDKQFTETVTYKLYLNQDTKSIDDIFYLLKSYQKEEPKLLFIEG